MTACYVSYGEARQDLISLLLSAGASPNARNEFRRTPLGAHLRFAHPPRVEVVRSLLRAGASLDGCLYNFPIEDVLRETEESNLPMFHGEEWIAIKALIATWKSILLCKAEWLPNRCCTIPNAKYSGI